MKKELKLGTLIVSLLVPLAIGGVSSLLTNDAMKQFHFFNKPPLSPPEWLFPIAWTILYVLMGLACYYVIRSDAEKSRKTKALLFYGLQLVMNFFWTLIFFNASEFLFAFIWLMLMWVVILITTVQFFKADRRAGVLMIPLCLWTTFAAYLNLGIYILSRTPAVMHK